MSAPPPKRIEKKTPHYPGGPSICSSLNRGVRARKAAKTWNFPKDPNIPRRPAEGVQAFAFIQLLEIPL